ncbi:hypothetical protein ACIBI9_22085 [Nonomuraea sp. NPDC050451]|uniref:hypothetical protein n=1 Tax=Nonomuraea sp. NPDC050451 TaxID=3364364 RepID=UPI00378F8E05
MRVRAEARVGAQWRSPFGATENRNDIFAHDHASRTFEWRSPSGATEGRNTYNFDNGYYVRWWRPPSEATEDRNFLEFWRIAAAAQAEWRSLPGPSRGSHQGIHARYMLVILVPVASKTTKDRNFARVRSRFSRSIL